MAVLSDLESVLLAALSDDAPWLRLQCESSRLPAEDRARLERIDRDGFVITSLLVRKLRFERICRGDRELEEWFGEEPERFTEAFRAYNRDVPPREYFPRPEAATFRAYLEKHGLWKRQRT